MAHRNTTKGLWFTLFILWTGLIIYIAWVEYCHQQQLVVRLAKAETIGSFNKDLVYRRWAAKQGGLYVPVSDYTPPNPYLDHVANRDVVTTDGKLLTLVNPAYMTRQVHELSTSQYGVKGHITSLNPLRPENAPDNWERKCLEIFEENPQEIVSIERIDDGEYFRLIRPMHTEAMCLKCHAGQGYEEGDIRGGISVSIPLAPYREAQLNLFSHSIKHHMLMWVLGGVALFFLRQQVQKRLRREDEAQQQVALSEEKYRVLFEESLIGIGVFDIDTGELIECNKTLALMVEREPSELIGQSQTILYPESEKGKNFVVGKMFRKHLEEAPGEVLKSKVITKNGRLRDVEIQSNVISFGNHSYVFGLFLDVTERNEFEHESYRFLQAIDQSPICLLMATSDGVPVYVNQAFTRRKGFSLEECKNRQNHINLFVRERVNALGTNDNKYTSTTPWIEELQARTKDGEMYWERISIAPAYDLNQKCSHFVFIGEDITEEKDSALHFEYLATHDSLTGLANRLLLHDRLEQRILMAKRSRSSVFLMLLDLDRFKVINDTLGHDRGDLLLQFVAERILDVVRESDTVARVGGDEFIVIFQDIDNLADALCVAELIQEQLSQPFDLDGRQIVVTASSGLSTYPDHGLSASELLRHADVAMYKAKEQQNQVCVFEPSMDHQLLQDMELEEGLRHAVARKELQLYYQPKVDTKSEKVVGLEALLRWVSPDKGMVSPGVFIPIAEQSGMILDIGLWVIEDVCRQLRQWCDMGYSVVPVAVNLSAKQFQSLDLPRQVSTMFDTYRIDPSWFQFELTESMIMQNPVSAIRIMGDFKNLGIRLAVDDFGTGYSSLNYLRRLPLDYLKIDRSFIDDVTQDFSADAVATSIIGIAKSLGMQTIAEGVETSEQLTFLRDNHCDFIQGFYFYKPMPAEDISKQLVRF